MIIAGDQKIEIGNSQASAPSPYEAKGPADMGEALKGFAELRDTRHFDEKAGDQAILALADPRHCDEARDLWTQKMGKEVYLGQFLAENALERLESMMTSFPGTCQRAKSALIDTIDMVIRNGGNFKTRGFGPGDPAEQMASLAKQPYCSREDSLRLLTSSMELNRRLERTDARTQHRGDIYKTLVNDLGMQGSMPDSDRASIKAALDKDAESLETRFDDRHFWYIKYLEDAAQR